MSRGDLQEMEVGTKQSRTAVNANAKAGDAMPNMSGTTPGQTAGWEDGAPHAALGCASRFRGRFEMESFQPPEAASARIE